MESKYAESEWFEKLTEQPDIPIESALWVRSFQSANEEDAISLPFELAHIWVFFLEVGPVSVGAMGAIPLTFSEINHWIQSTKSRLSAWEIILLHRCSQEWVSAQYEAKQYGAIPPWTAMVTDDRRRALAERLLKAPIGGKKVRKK